jgi:hypothetical protein
VVLVVVVLVDVVLGGAVLGGIVVVGGLVEFAVVGAVVTMGRLATAAVVAVGLVVALWRSAGRACRHHLVAGGGDGAHDDECEEASSGAPDRRLNRGRW